MAIVNNLGTPGTQIDTMFSRYIENVPPASLHPGYVSGLWYGSLNTSSPIGTAAIAVDTLYATPMPILYPCTIQQLGTAVGTQGVGNMRVAIYKNGTDGRPGTFVAECSTALDLNATSNFSISAGFTTNPQLVPGLYWFASVFNAITGIPYTTQSNAQHGGGIGHYIGSPVAAGVVRGGSSPNARLTRTAALAYTDPMPATFGPSTLGTGSPGSPLIGFRVA